MNKLATPENVLALDRAAELIADDLNWCQAVLAETLEGFEVDPEDERACRWCAVGAVYRYEVSDLTFSLDLARTAYAIYGVVAIEEVNDTLGRIPAKHCIEALAAELRAQLP